MTSWFFSRTSLSIGLGFILLIAGGVYAFWPNRVVKYRQSEVKEISHQAFDELLSKYVTENRLVRYDAWSKNEEDQKKLDQYLSKMTSASPHSAPDLFPSREAQLAYWINLYNALMIDVVLEEYPLKSVRDIQVSAASSVIEGLGVFKEYKFSVADEQLSLSNIEHDIIREEFSDPRIHFAINCASMSCPPLRREAYKPDRLDQQLQDSTNSFINNGSSVVVHHEKNRVQLSRIFDWYRSDYIEYLRNQRNMEDAHLLKYARIYANPDLEKDLNKALKNSYEVEFKTYDWSLNDASRSSSGSGQEEKKSKTS